MKNKYLALVALIYCVINGAIFLLNRNVDGYDVGALIIANIVLAVLSLFSFFSIKKQTATGRAQAFVNGVYAATLLRLMVCLGGIFIYAYLNQGNLHRPTIFAMLGLYILYTAIETVAMSKMVKK